MSVESSIDIDILQDKVTLFLQRYSKDAYVKANIAPYLAKISLDMNKLYVDLGFKDTNELANYMKEYFPILTKRKPKHLLWKKFIYDSIGETAPACVDCDDQNTCWKCKK
jgi:nitrogen fixation protein NifQ